MVWAKGGQVPEARKGNKTMKFSVIIPCLFTDEWQIDLAMFAIGTMWTRTQIPFELVVVETASKFLSDNPDLEQARNVKYIHRPERTTYTQDFNAGLRVAEGEICVHTATDIIVGDQWLEAIEDVFIEREDAGLATLTAKEPGWILGPNHPEPGIVESFYGGFMAFRQGFYLDEGFPDQFSDYDLGMQICEKGLRCYRNNASDIYHLKEITYRGMYSPQEAHTRFLRGRELFLKKWEHRHYLIKDLIMKGGTQYGQESKLS